MASSRFSWLMALAGRRHRGGRDTSHCLWPQRVAEEWWYSGVICMIFAYHSPSTTVALAYLKKEGSGTKADKNTLLEFKSFHFFFLSRKKFLEASQACQMKTGPVSRNIPRESCAHCVAPARILFSAEHINSCLSAVTFTVAKWQFRSLTKFINIFVSRLPPHPTREIALTEPYRLYAKQIYSYFCLRRKMITQESRRILRSPRQIGSSEFAFGWFQRIWIM